MATTIIKDEQQYKKDMIKFKSNVIEFYKHGKHLFLKDHHGKIGGGKTAYICIPFNFMSPQWLLVHGTNYTSV